MRDPLSSDVPRSQIAAEARNLLLEHCQAFAGLNVSKPVAQSAIDPSADLRLIQRVK